MAEEFESTNNLENLLSPFCYSPETPLTRSTPEVPGGIYLSGFISQDCTWGCCFNHSVIKCFPVDKYFEDNQAGIERHSSNSSVAVSSASYTFSGGRIACATELAIHNQRTSSGARKLLLGISYTKDNNNRELRGAVVIFDPLRCVPLKWIEIPEPVSSITVLSHFEEGGSNRPFFNETMMAMVGIAAVGLRGGSVIIVDLGLDDPNLNSAFALDMKDISNLKYRLVYVNPHEYVIATKRHKAVSKRSLIALKFTNEPEDVVVSDEFHYCKPNGESILMLPKNSVAVTCIEYVPVIGSLLVGFTCGGFQIWRVNNMELQFSSDPVHLERNIPVFGFTFQQPVDDPKNYCYVWVLYGNNSAECTNAHLELHSLYYENKIYIENFGYTYEGFKQCVRRMAFPLQDDFLHVDSDNEDNSFRSSARPLRIWTQPDSDLMFCAWEVGRGSVYYLGAFDMNQWYSNHTKECIFYNPVTGLCPYWVTFPIEVPEHSTMVLDVRIMPKSLMRWENPHAKLDVHLYPASVSFRAVCLTNHSVSAFEHFGIQEKLIRIMLRDGHSLMIQPKSLRSSFLRYGLEPIFPQTYCDDLSDKDRDRYFMFSVLLESRRTAAIIHLASVWLDGSYANVGCTVDLIIDWIGSYMSAIRSIADDHWENLLTFADDTLPPETIHFINFSNFAWTSLHRMLLTLMNPSEVYSARGLELEDMKFGLSKLVQYSAALLMMFKAKLLPEKDRSFIRSLTEFYQQRRNETKLALQSSNFIDSQYKRTQPLMIDHLMDSLLTEEDVREEWHVAEGQQLYPPQHVGYLVNMFMWPDADPKAVSRIFMYFLFDLHYIYLQCTDAEQQRDTERKVCGDFKAVMDTAAEEYSEVLSLWLLDRGVCDDVLVHMKDKDRLFEADGLPWCAATIVLTAAGYENDVAELLLKSCPVNLAKLLFSLMTSSVDRYNSLAELMICSNLSTDEGLLQQFFEISETRDRLGEFIRTKSKELPETVKRALLEFLNKTDSVKRLSQMLMYYVHAEDYQKLEEEFVRVRTALRQRNLSDSERRYWGFQENYIVHLLNSTKGSIVNSFLRMRSPQLLRQSKSTLSIKAKPAELGSPTETPERSQNGSKVPIHLRRLKLSETIPHDPLSPLRRYAGRIQSSVTADPAEHDVDKRFQRYARKSFSRRASFSSTHLSMMHSNVFETTALNSTVCEDQMNRTGKRNSINLASLLKTPSVDHRSENRQRGLSMTFRQSMSSGEVDTDTATQHRHVQSIMKEKDSSKPKVMKKVELRLENLSLQSIEDEKDITVYEDADENLPDDDETDEYMQIRNLQSQKVPNVEAGQGEPESFENDSATEGPSFSDAEQNITDSEVVKELITSQLEESKALRSEILVSSTNTEEDVTQSIKIESKEGDSTSPVIATDTQDEFEVSSVDNEICLNTVGPVDDVVNETLQQVFVKPSSSSVQMSSSVTEDLENKISETSTCTVPSQKVIEADVEIEQKERSRTSKSRTPTRKISEENVAEIQSHPIRRSSRSRTPTRIAAEEVQETSEEKTDECLVRKSGSKTPTHEQSEVNQDEDKFTQRSLRKSRSKTPSREPTEEPTEPEPKRVRKTSRVSRSMTPNREVIESLPEEPGLPEKSLRSRVSRSRTPTRDMVISEEVLEESVIIPPQKKSRGTRSSSTVTTTDLDEQSDSSLVQENKPVRRSARTSLSRTREIFADEYYDELETTILQRSRRSSRSKTPTRQTTGDIHDELESKPERRTLRATRSTTPQRDAMADVSMEGSDVKSSRRTTRVSKTPNIELVEKLEESPAKKVSRITRASKTPNRELEEIVEESPTKKFGRSTRTSKTPTRDVKEDISDVEASKTKRGGRKGVPSSKAKQSPARSETTIDEEDSDDSEKSAEPQKKLSTEKPKKAQKRRLKYFEHHQDLSTVMEDPITDQSVLDATVMPSTSQAPTRSIKGIRARPQEPVDEFEEQAKPSKRRKAVIDDTLFELDSEVSSRSASSRKSSASSKGRSTRRKGKGRSSSQSTA